ncbi:hypothetical protein F400_gp064 [Bacillus phage BCD7]|uniref:Uncharacterized protein n=1 Tax=Bacillus phage BCD7 TaxID=1136534 RepID=J9PUL6_9CAUD|nr:hypothetical protein F400_gp064 [Bacillus phage BCD7]AEZ50511.1 hypothetical protein BCD7_0064 [Bacillus phage BCD7]
MEQIFHVYKCEKGCGHTTIVDKYYLRKLMHCAVCGEKQTMVYQGETNIGEIRKPTLINLKNK